MILLLIPYMLIALLAYALLYVYLNTKNPFAALFWPMTLTIYIGSVISTIFVYFLNNVDIYLDKFKNKQ